MSLLVKICGLSTPETLETALDAGADMVGFVFFPPSPRHVSLETGRDLGRQVKRRALKVALTVDADDATLDNIMDALSPDIFQLHGKESVARLRDIKQQFGRPVMKAVPVATSADLAVLPGYAAVADRILFDARAPKDATRPGGLGAPFDWHLLENLDLEIALHGLGRASRRQRCGSPPRHRRRWRRRVLGCRERPGRQGPRADQGLHSRRARQLKS